jgi:plasmid maintenance system antidote protein VapI
MARPAIHPGEILADELNELQVTPTELSRQIAVPPNRISQIIQGKRAPSPATRASPRALVSDQRPILAQSAIGL